VIKGIGIDLVKIERIKKTVQRWGILTSKEMEVEQLRKKTKFTYIAGRFAAKEAIFKSLGFGASWQDVEVLSKENGKPYATLKGRAKKIAQKRGIRQIFITLSHNDDSLPSPITMIM